MNNKKSKKQSASVQWHFHAPFRCQGEKEQENEKKQFLSAHQLTTAPHRLKQI